MTDALDALADDDRSRLKRSRQPDGRSRDWLKFIQPPGAGHRRLHRPAGEAHIGFTEWTRDGRLRHPRFIGLRDDKDPKSVVREGG